MIKKFKKISAVVLSTLMLTSPLTFAMHNEPKSKMDTVKTGLKYFVVAGVGILIKCALDEINKKQDAKERKFDNCEKFEIKPPQRKKTTPKQDAKERKFGNCEKFEIKPPQRQKTTPKQNEITEDDLRFTGYYIPNDLIKYIKNFLAKIEKQSKVTKQTLDIAKQFAASALFCTKCCIKVNDLRHHSKEKFDVPAKYMVYHLGNHATITPLELAKEIVRLLTNMCNQYSEKPQANELAFKLKNVLALDKEQNTKEIGSPQRQKTTPKQNEITENDLSFTGYYIPKHLIEYIKEFLNKIKNQSQVTDKTLRIATQFIESTLDCMERYSNTDNILDFYCIEAKLTVATEAKDKYKLNITTPCDLSKQIALVLTEKCDEYSTKNQQAKRLASKLKNVLTQYLND